MAKMEKTAAFTDKFTGETKEKKASVKNGTWRMIITIISMLICVVVLLLLVRFAGSKAGWIYGLIRFISVFLVIGIYASHKAGTIRMTWIIVIMFEPIFGTILYLMIGMNGHTMKMRRRYEEIDQRLLPLLPENRDVEERVRRLSGRLYGVVRYIRDQAGYPVYENTSVTYYDDAEKGFEAQKKELARAERFIFMEYHAIEDAECWHEILEVLEDRVRAGVEVRVFYDDMGSLGFINMDFVKRTEAKGIKCRVFNPFLPGLNLFLNNRDHRKITVIDGKVGFTGGYNLANEYFHRSEPFGFWKDTGVRLEGDAVDSLTMTFLEMWNAVSDDDKDDVEYLKYFSEGIGEAYHLRKKTGTGGEALAQAVRRPRTKILGMAAEEGPVISRVQTGEKTGKAAEKETLELREQTGGTGGKTSGKGSGTGFVQPYADSPMDGRHIGEDVYISIAEGATDYVWYITPYLIITDEMTHALSLAAKRGVDVRIITPGIPDKKIVYSMTRSYYNGLTRNGVRIYEFTPGFCHAKMCVSDDLIATCGTINLDYRSLYHHFENGCLYADCEAVMETRRDFEAVFARSNDVTEYYTTGRGAIQRFSQLVLRLLSPLM